MSRLEDELKAALQPKEPPAGFAERVMDRLGEPPAERRSGWLRSLLDALRFPRLQLAGVTVAVLAGLIIAAVYYPRAEQERPVDQAGARPETTGRQETTRAAVSTSPSVPMPSPPVKRVTVAKRRSPDTAGVTTRNHSDIDGERARDQLLRAFQITTSTLSEAREAVIEGLNSSRGTR